MPLNAAGVNVAADAVRAAAGFLSLHSGAAGTTGANQTTAARQAAGWAAATDGDIIAGTKNFTGGSPNGPVAEVGYWSAATGGIFYGSDPITGDASFNAAGEYQLTSARINF